MFNLKVLSKNDIMNIIEMKPVIAGVENVYSLKSNEKTEVWPTVFYEFEPGKADMDIKSGFLKDTKLFGHKTVSWFGNNKEKGLPDLVGVIVVYDGNNGLPLGILDASYITGARTGAAGAIGAKYLARKNSTTLLVIGAGNQAGFQIAAVLTELSGINKVMVADPLDVENAKKFIENIPDRLTTEFKIDIRHVTFEAVSAIEEAVSQSDIIITVTPSKKPIIKKEWVKAGTHFSCIGADMPGKEEIDPEIMRNAKIFVDDKFHCMQAGEIEIPLNMNIISEKDIIGEIGDLITGKVTGRTSDEDITIYDATGMALLDIATAKTALDLANEKSLGSTVEL